MVAFNRPGGWAPDAVVGAANGPSLHCPGTYMVGQRYEKAQMTNQPISKGMGLIWRTHSVWVKWSLYPLARLGVVV